MTPFDIKSDLHASLARFKFAYIDLSLLHRADPSDPVFADVLERYFAAEADEATDRLLGR